MSFRVPPKLRTDSPEAAWHNKMREVMMSQRPIASRKGKTAHTTKGFFMEGGKAEESSSASAGSAVWL
jgi:hypothetical protein